MTPTEAIRILIAASMTEAAIGTAVGVSQGTVNKIKRGDMIPNWDTGQKLVDLARTTLPAANDDRGPRKGKRKKAA